MCSSWWFQSLWKILVKLDHFQVGVKIQNIWNHHPVLYVSCMTKSLGFREKTVHTSGKEIDVCVFCQSYCPWPKWHTSWYKRAIKILYSYSSSTKSNCIWEPFVNMYIYMYISLLGQMFSYPTGYLVSFQLNFTLGGNMLQLTATVADELVGCGEGPSL